MGDDRRLLSPGDRWRPAASTLNGYQAAADYVRQLSRSGGALPGSSAAAQPCIVPIKTFPFLDPIRGDARFLALLRKMRLE